MTTTNPPLPAVPISLPAPPARRRRAPLLLSALSGLLVVLSFPHADWGWLSWAAFVPILTTFPHRRMRDALACGFVFGVVYFGGVLAWLAVFAGHAIGPALGIVAWLIATLAQTLVVLLWAAGAQRLAIKGGWAWKLGVPALWAIGEWVRQLGILGTGWGDLAYAQHKTLAILQTTKLTGVWGLSFLIVLVNVALTEWVKTKRVGKFVTATAMVTAGAWIFGFWTLQTENLSPTFQAAALQANINQDVPWKNARPADPAYVENVMATFSRLSKEAAARGAKLTVWPETAFPGYLRTDTELRGKILRDAAANDQALLIGGNDYFPETKKDGNALFLVTPRGKIAGAYEKRQLVPFGEFVPGRKWLTFLEALHLTIYDRQPGADVQPLLNAGPPVGSVGAALCYESSYGWLTREQVARGAGLLVVSTDDTWFGRTAAARQHAAAAAVRAAESDRYLIRAAATGISQIISPTGQVLTEADLFERKVVAAPVQSRQTLTPYVRFGDWFVALCGILAVAALAVPAFNDARARGRKTARNLGR